MSAVYSAVIRSVDKIVPTKLIPLWNHPAGPKTVFFWAPVFKWSLVIAGLSDLARPADQLSIAQSASLAATGMVWSRYSLVIIPKNYGLFSVNVFVAFSSSAQLIRAYLYHKEKEAELKAQEAAITGNSAVATTTPADLVKV